MRWGIPVRFEDSHVAAPAGRLIGAVAPEAPVRLIGVLRSSAGAKRFVDFAVASGFAAKPLGNDGMRLELSGTYGCVERAFQPEGLGLYEETTPQGAKQFVGRSGCISLPAQCLPDVIAVIGIDCRSCGRPAVGGVIPNAQGLYRPREIAARYDFPTFWDGTGQTIGVVALGGGCSEDELQDYLQSQGVHRTGGSIQEVSADGTVGDPTTDSSDPDHKVAVFEVQMDVSVVAAVAPGAQIVVYYGAAGQTSGLYNALDKAIHDEVHKPSVISVSWEFAQVDIDESTLAAFDALLAQAKTRRITVCVASGDHGAKASADIGDPTVAFPACSPHVLACGGTTLLASGVESAWGTDTNEGSGGGYSPSPMPSYQEGSVKPGRGRGVPDVAAMAVPGYESVAARWSNRAFNGTSAAAPLWAALIALINQGRQQHPGTPVGFVNEALYLHQDRAFIDIQAGSNTAFQAERGWDELTGLGTPRGSEILRLF